MSESVVPPSSQGDTTEMGLKPFLGLVLYTKIFFLVVKAMPGRTRSPASTFQTPGFFSLFTSFKYAFRSFNLPTLAMASRFTVKSLATASLKA